MNDYSPVYRRCGCTDPTTGRRYGDTCPRLVDDAGHGSWYFSVRFGGQRVRRGGFRTAQAAEQGRQDLVSQAPEPAADAGLTVGAWLDTWVASLPKRVRPSTATAYTAHVVNVLRPALGHHRLGALTRAQVQAMFDELAEHTNRYQVKITASTVQRVRATLRRALNAAAAHGYLTDNPARMLELPSLSDTVDAMQRAAGNPATGLATHAETKVAAYMSRHVAEVNFVCLVINKPDGPCDVTVTTPGDNLGMQVGCLHDLPDMLCKGQTLDVFWQPPGSPDLVDKPFVGQASGIITVSNRTPVDCG